MNYHKELLSHTFRAWDRFYRQSLVKKLRNRACLGYLQAKEKSLLRENFGKWRRFLQENQRNQRIVAVFKHRQALQMQQKILFAFQRNVRLMMRKNLIQLDKEKTLLEVEIKNNEKMLKELDNEKFDAITKQRDGKLLIAELNKKIEQQGQEIVHYNRVRRF